MTDFLALSLQGLARSDDSPVIPASELERLAEAADLIEAASARAAQIEAASAEAFEAEKARGYAEGRAEAAREEAARKMQSTAELDAALARTEQELGALVADCVRRIIEDYDDSARSTGIVRSALHTMRSEKRGQLFVPPESLPDIRAGLDQLLEGFPEIELIDVIPDAELQPPNLRLESAMGVVSFVLNDTIAELRALLERA